MSERDSSVGPPGHKASNSKLHNIFHLGAHVLSKRSKPRSPRTLVTFSDASKSRPDLFSLVQLTAETVTFLRGALKRESNGDLLALLIELCSISGLLFQLKELSEGAKSKIDWKNIEDMLWKDSGPLKQFSLNLELLYSNYSPEALSSAKDKVGPSDKPAIVQIKISIERLKPVFAYALLNDTNVLSKAIFEIATATSQQTGRPKPLWKSATVDVHGRFLKWDSEAHCSFEHNEAFKKVESETGETIIKSSEFEAWMKSGPAFLWLCGIPGSGKTVLCAKIIEHLKKNGEETDSLAYYYFDGRQGGTRDISTCLRSLSAQLYKGGGDLPVAVQALFSKHPTDDQPFDRFALLEILLSFTMMKRRIFIILDAIDEGLRREEILDILSIMTQKKANNLHLLVSSDFKMDIENQLKTVEWGKIYVEDPSLNAICVHIHRLMHDDLTASFWDDSLRQAVERSLISGADLGFQWVDCCMEMFRRCKAAPEVTDILDTMPRSIFDCYDSMLSRISMTDVPEACKIFQWLAFAERYLLLEEVAEAAVYNPDENEWLHSDRRVLDPKEVDDICYGLITINSSTDSGHGGKRVCFIHQTAKEFLLSEMTKSPKAGRFSITETESQKMICHASLAYLRFSTPDTLDRGPVLRPLLQYAKKYWFEHVKAVRNKGPMPKELVKLTIELFDLKRKESILKGIDTFAASELEGPEAVTCELQKDRGFPPALYYACLLGMSELVPPLLLRNESKFAGGFCGSPLHAAAYSGDPQTLIALIRFGADINFESGNYGSALQTAIHYGHDSIVRMLLDFGADPNAGSGYYGNALQAAAVRGNAEQVQTLIEYGADIDAKGGKYGNALIAAAQGSHKHVVQILLENGADLNECGTSENYNALYAAASSGHSEVVKLLLDRGADSNAECGDYDSALKIAAQGGYLNIVEMLIENGAQVHSEIAELVLHLAVQGGRGNIVDQLLRRRSLDADLRNDEGLSPLMMAAIAGNVEIVRLLLERGVNMKARDPKGATALQMAVEGGHEAVVKLLWKEETGSLDTLKEASWTSHSGMMQLLESRTVQSEHYYTNIVAESGKIPREDFEKIKRKLTGQNKILFRNTLEKFSEQMSKLISEFAELTKNTEMLEGNERLHQWQQVKQNLEQFDAFLATTREDEVEELRPESPRRRALSPAYSFRSDEVVSDLEGSLELPAQDNGRPASPSQPLHGGPPDDPVARPHYPPNHDMEQSFRHLRALPGSLGEGSSEESMLRMKPRMQQESIGSRPAYSRANSNVVTLRRSRQPSVALSSGDELGSIDENLGSRLE